MGLSNSAVIVIVLVAALATVSTAAGIFSIVSPAQMTIWSPTTEQQRYMRNVRLRNLKLLLSESGMKYSKSQR